MSVSILILYRHICKHTHHQTTGDFGYAQAPTCTSYHPPTNPAKIYIGLLFSNHPTSTSQSHKHNSSIHSTLYSSKGKAYTANNHVVSSASHPPRPVQSSPVCPLTPASKHVLNAQVSIRSPCCTSLFPRVYLPSRFPANSKDKPADSRNA